MIRAYVLIEAEVGKGNSVVRELRKVAGVTCADRVTGPYDVICQVEVSDLDKLASLVRDEIHAVDGIARTVTCLSLRL